MTAMTLADVLAVLHDVRTDEVVIPTMASVHPWMQHESHPLDFIYLPSSMGQGTALALGIALAQPARRVIVASGDGSLLMNLGSLVTIANEAPKNLVVLLFDNGVYQVTGGQRHPGSGRVDFAALARACGLSRVFAFSDIDDWRSQAATVIASEGPVFAWLCVAAEEGAPSARSPGPTAARVAAFRAALGCSPT